MGNSNLVEVLLQAETEIEAKDLRGSAALLIACHYGHSNVVEILLQAGVHIQAENEVDRQPLCKPVKMDSPIVFSLQSFSMDSKCNPVETNKTFTDLPLIFQI
eukprot:gene24419-10432_t